MAYSKFDLTGKVALITGGNSGIGLGFAEGLAEAGADVCIWGTNEAKNGAAEEKLKGYGHRVLAQRCDVGEQEQVNESFTKAVETLGRVDSCFANAGIGGRGTAFHDVSAEEWHSIFRVNMDGVFYTLQAAVRHMVSRDGGGSLVVTSSGTAIFGAPRSAHYGATKAGINALIRSLCVGYARYGIRANAIMPGLMDTPMAIERRAREQNVSRDDIRAARDARVPIKGKMGTAWDVAYAALFLASDEAGFITGIALPVDGGSTARVG